METLESLFYRGNHLVLLIMLVTVGTKHQHFLVKSVCLQRGMRVIWGMVMDGLLYCFTHISLFSDTSLKPASCMFLPWRNHQDMLRPEAEERVPREEHRYKSDTSTFSKP
jgi:hypothetical protein